MVDKIQNENNESTLVRKDSVGDDPFIDPKLTDVFDRYALALDSGNEDGAEKILESFPSIGEEFHVQFRGLYLLERAARDGTFDSLSDRSDLKDKPGKPKRLGDFEIEYELGRGGMGIVYAAKQISLQRPVALKILPFTSVLDPRQVARFQNEAQAAASLHHPNIVPVYGVGCERGVHYYSMQLIEGQTLAQFIRHKQANEGNESSISANAETVDELSTLVTIKSSNYVQKIVELGVRVAEAIHFAHEHGIVHRDIKPSNLLLDREGKVWVADFGLARCRGNSDLTSQGDQLGTLRYMSPEQAAGRNNQVDFHTDIYSLGVTLYEMLTLSRAHLEQDRLQLLSKIESSEPKPIRSINPSISKDLETVICRAISKVPSDRYSSGQEFADDLARCLHGKPVLAKRRTVVDRCAAAMLRHKRIFAGSAVAIIGLTMVAITVASIFYNQRQREHVAAENARFYLQQAHKSVDRFGVLLTDELSEIPGTKPLRRKLLGEAIGYYNDFLQFAGSAPELNLEKALAHSQLGRLHERAADDKTALVCYEAAIHRFGILEASADAKTEMAVCLDRMGLIHKRHGKFLVSARAFRDSLSCFESMNVSSTSDAAPLASYAQTCGNLALLYWTEGDLESSAAQFEKALETLNPRIDDSPTMEELLRDAELYSAFYKIQGNYFTALRELDGEKSESTLRDSIASLQRLNAGLRALTHSGDASTQSASDPTANYIELFWENSSHLADMKNNLAALLCHQEKLNEAERLALAAVGFCRQAVDRSPVGYYADERLATALNTIGEIYWRQNAIQQCEESFAESEGILLRIANEIPDRPETLSRLAGVMHNRSLIAFRCDRVDEAREMASHAIRYQEYACELLAGNSRYQTLLDRHRGALAKFESSASQTSDTLIDNAVETSAIHRLEPAG